MTPFVVNAADMYQQSIVALAKAEEKPSAKVYRSLNTMLEECYLVGASRFGHNFIAQLFLFNKKVFKLTLTLSNIFFKLSHSHKNSQPSFRGLFFATTEQSASHTHCDEESAEV